MFTTFDETLRGPQILALGCPLPRLCLIPLADLWRLSPDAKNLSALLLYSKLKEAGRLTWRKEKDRAKSKLKLCGWVCWPEMIAHTYILNQMFSIIFLVYQPYLRCLWLTWLTWNFSGTNGGHIDSNKFQQVHKLLPPTTATTDQLPKHLPISCVLCLGFNPVCSEIILQPNKGNTTLYQNLRQVSPCVGIPSPVSSTRTLRIGSAPVLLFSSSIPRGLRPAAACPQDRISGKDASTSFAAATHLSRGAVYRRVPFASCVGFCWFLIALMMFIKPRA